MQRFLRLLHNNCEGIPGPPDIIVEMTPEHGLSALENAPSLIPANLHDKHGMGRVRTNERRSQIRVH